MPNPKYRVISVKPVKTNPMFVKAEEEVIQYALQKSFLEPGWEYGEDTENAPILIPFKAQIVVNGSRAVTDCLFKLLIGNGSNPEMECEIKLDFPECHLEHYSAWETQCYQRLRDMILDAAGKALDCPVPFKEMLVES